jgi:glutamine amidotransferase PdxT
VPPPAFVRIRYYGFLSHAKKGKLLQKIKINLETKTKISSQKQSTTSGVEIEKTQKTNLSSCCKAPVIIKLLAAVNTIQTWDSS